MKHQLGMNTQQASLYSKLRQEMKGCNTKVGSVNKHVFWATVPSQFAMQRKAAVLLLYSYVGTGGWQRHQSRHPHNLLRLQHPVQSWVLTPHKQSCTATPDNIKQCEHSRPVAEGEHSDDKAISQDIDIIFRGFSIQSKAKL